MIGNVYNYLVFSLAIILVVSSIYLFWQKNTNGKKYKGYFLSRRLLAFAFAALSIQCFLLSLFDIRTHNRALAITMNITSYELVVSLIYLAYMNLMHPPYIRKIVIVAKVIIFSVISLIAWSGYFVCAQNVQLTRAMLITAGIMAFIDLAYMDIKFMITYKKISQNISEYCYENINIFSSWMYRSALFAICIGTTCIPLSFLSRDIILILVVSAMFLTVYCCSSCIKYLLNYTLVTSTISDMDNFRNSVEDDDIKGSNPDMELLTEQSNIEIYNDLDPDNKTTLRQFESEIERWIAEKQYLSQDVNVNTMLEFLNVNRSYFSYNFNLLYNSSFRTFVNKHRIEFAKDYILNNPNVPIDIIASESGYKSRTHFIKIFKEVVGVPPSEWKKTGLNG